MWFWSFPENVHTNGYILCLQGQLQLAILVQHQPVILGLVSNQVRQPGWVVEWLSTFCVHIFRKSPYFHHKYILLCIFKSEIAHLRQTSFSMPNLHKSNMAAILDISVMFSPILVMADECFILFLGTCISNIIFYHIYCIHTMEPLYIMPLSNHITSIATVLSNSLTLKSRRT